MQVITANDLFSGAVIYWSQAGWRHDLAKAAVFLTPQQAEQALAGLSQHSEKAIGAYIIAVEDEGGIRPCHIRERIRAQGPSHQETHIEGGSVHVSL